LENAGNLITSSIKEKYKGQGSRIF